MPMQITPNEQSLGVEHRVRCGVGSPADIRTDGCGPRTIAVRSEKQRLYSCLDLVPRRGAEGAIPDLRELVLKVAFQVPRALSMADERRSVVFQAPASDRVQHLAIRQQPNGELSAQV